MSTDKEINNKNDGNKVICPNCGAAIEEKEPACPFCGYINITGAEEKFMQDMEQTEEELSRVPQLQKEHLKKTVSKNGKIILTAVLLTICLLLGVLGLRALFDFVYYGRDQEVDIKAEMLWEKETFPLLDEMYAAGDYDGILEFQENMYLENEENHTSHGIFNWEHYDFITIYERFQTSKEYMDFIDQGDEITKYHARNLVYDCMWFHYRQYDGDYMILTEEEKEMIEEYRLWYEDIFYNRLKFTDKEADQLYEKAEKNNVLRAQPCFDYADKIWERIE